MALVLLLGLTALADATLPADLTVIEAEALQYDTSLTGTLNLPDGVTVIGARAFAGCTGLTEQLVIPATVTSIASGAFSGCDELLRVVFLGDVVTIASDAFSGCGEIAFVCNPDSSAAAFAQSHGFTQVDR